MPYNDEPDVSQVNVSQQSFADYQDSLYQELLYTRQDAPNMAEEPQQQSPLRRGAQAVQTVNGSHPVNGLHVSNGLHVGNELHAGRLLTSSPDGIISISSDSTAAILEDSS